MSDARPLTNNKHSLQGAPRAAEGQPVALEGRSVAPDGRRLRSEQSRLRIVQAFSALVRDGVVVPTAEQVADRAEVGLRSVFRHFQDMERLYREIALEVDAITLPFLKYKYQAKDWQARVLEMVALRCRLFEALLPFHVATLVHSHESAFLAESLRQGTRKQRDSLVLILPESFRRQQARVEALDLVMSISSWLRLRREQGLSIGQAERSVLAVAQALIGLSDAAEADTRSSLP